MSYRIFWLHLSVRSPEFLLKSSDSSIFFRESKISLSDERRTKAVMSNYSPIATFAGEFGLFNIEQLMVKKRMTKTVFIR